MEFDRQTDRLPFHDPDAAEQARRGATAPSHDSRIRHLQRSIDFIGLGPSRIAGILLS
jgi:hypothetical protein